jgi:hypothetical protein
MPSVNAVADEPLLDYLLEQGHRPEFTCRFRWANGSDLGTPHNPAERTGVMNRQMFGAAVVPENDGSVGPSKTAGKFRPAPLPQQIIQQRLALRLRPTLEADGIGTIDEQ